MGALATGWVVHVKRQGRAVVIAVLVWGASITAFGLVRSLAVCWCAWLLPVGPTSSRPSSAIHPPAARARSAARRMNAIQTAVVAGGPGSGTSSLAGSDIGLAHLFGGIGRVGLHGGGGDNDNNDAGILAFATSGEGEAHLPTGPGTAPELGPGDGLTGL